MEKKEDRAFSKGFINDMGYLLHECAINNTDGCTVCLEYPSYDLDIDIVFKAKKKGAAKNEHESQQ